MLGKVAEQLVVEQLVVLGKVAEQLVVEQQVPWKFLLRL